MRKSILFLALAPIASAIAAPSWFDSPKTNDSNYMYEVGVGDSLKGAKQEALAALSNSIHTKVSSEFSEVIRVENDEADTSILSKNQSQSKNIELPDVNWTNIESEGGLYYVEAQLDKNSFVNYYTNKIESSLKKIGTLKNKSEIDLSEFLTLSKYNSELESLRGNALVVSSYSPKGQGYLTQINHINDLKSDYLSKICFNVENKFEKRFVQRSVDGSLQDLISNSGLKVQDKSSCEKVKANYRFVSGSNGYQLKMSVELGSPTVAKKLIEVSTSKQSGYSSRNALDDMNSALLNYFDEDNNILVALMDDSKSRISIEVE